MILSIIQSVMLSLSLYDEDSGFGPSNWYQEHAICGGPEQTPINIEHSEAKCERISWNIRYLNNRISSVKLQNDGHGFKFLFDFAGGITPILRFTDAEGVRHKYTLHSAHIHWGSDCQGGSEHTLNGHRYAAEMHLVHFNSKYQTIDEAAPLDDGLAVLGIFFELADNSTYEAKYANSFTKYLPEIPKKGDTFYVPKEEQFKNILGLIKSNVRNVYSYDGSLTTPPCFESVRWIVSADPIRIYPSELKAFQKVFPANFRPLQKRNNREVIRSCYCY